MLFTGHLPIGFCLWQSVQQTVQAPALAAPTALEVWVLTLLHVVWTALPKLLIADSTASEINVRIIAYSTEEVAR